MADFIAEPGGHRDGVFGLARHSDRVLMVRNPRVSRGGLAAWWDLPGGAVHAGETLPGALAREWREETGSEARVGDLFLVADGVKRRPEGRVLYTWRAFFFHVEAAPGEPRPGAGIEAAEWVPAGEARTRLEAPYHAALRAWLDGAAKHYAPIEWVEHAAAEPGGGAIPRDLLILAAAGAVGDTGLLRAQTPRALERGESAARIEETLLQLVPYAGYPRAITAFGAVRALLGDASPGEPAALADDGAAIFEQVYGDTAPGVRAGLEELHPALAAWTLQHAYGSVLARDHVLTLRERELLAVSILTALGGLSDPLLGHMRAALRLGASAAEIAAAVQVVPASVGAGRREAARLLLARL